LFQAGTQLEIKEKYGLTPLLSAENEETAIGLIEAAANLSAKSNDGGTVEDTPALRTIQGFLPSIIKDVMNNQSNESWYGGGFLFVL